MNLCTLYDDLPCCRNPDKPCELACHEIGWRDEIAEDPVKFRLWLRDTSDKEFFAVARRWNKSNRGDTTAIDIYKAIAIELMSRVREPGHYNDICVQVYSQK